MSTLMSKTKVLTNEHGQAVVTLPVSNLRVTFRSPKGKDIKALEAFSTTSDSQTAAMMYLGSLLAVEPSLTVEDIEDWDAQDVLTLGEVIACFPAFRKDK